MKLTQNEANCRRSLGNCESHSHPRFFKLMVSSSQFKNLRIPKEFASTYSNDLCSSVILTVPSGETQRVELVEKNNELWFCDGWKDFVEYFSIGFGYFLLFTYQGNSNFTVNIFDLSACEISYQCNAPDTFQVLHDEPSHEVLLDNDSNYDNDDNNDDIINKQESTAVVNCVGRSSYLKKIKRLNKIVTAAGISLPENPHFVTDIKKYVLQGGQFLNVPLYFGRQWLKCELHVRQRIKLEIYDGRQWDVDCVRDSKCSFRQGWSTFARQTGLEVGDVCVFELKDTNKYVLKVHVVKKSEIKIEYTS